VPVFRQLAFLGQIDEVIDAGLAESRQPRACIGVIAANRIFAGQQAAGNYPVAVRQRSVQSSAATREATR
jgi:hypothetical protein